MGKVNISDYNISNYKKLYFETAREYAGSLSGSCIKLEENPSDNDAVKEMYISSHSLRSQSQVMSFTNMGNIAWAIEKITKVVLDGKYILNERIIVVLKEAVAEINLLLTEIERGNKEKNLDYLVKKLDDIPRI